MKIYISRLHNVVANKNIIIINYNICFNLNSVNRFESEIEDLI